MMWRPASRGGWFEEDLMALLWIANALLLFVVAPVVIMLLNRVLRPTFEIKHYVEDVLEHGVLLSGTLDCVPNLIRSCELTGIARLNVTRYGLALARLLPD
jgi:hypothetical protein